MKRVDTEEFFRLMHPKPVFLLSSFSGEKKNACAVSWATPVSEEPPLLAVCVTKEAYTSELIKESKEFVLNVPSESQLSIIWGCGTLTGRKTDKSKKLGYEYEPGKQVSAPRIKGCIGYIECKLKEIYDGGECYIFLGDVVHAEADENYFKKGWKEKAPILLHVWGREFTQPGKRIKVKG